MEQQNVSSKILLVKKAILGLFTLTIMFLGLATGSALLQQDQDIRNKAAELPTDTLEKTKTYTSQYGYKINFNPNLWTTSQDLSQGNLQEITFSLQKEGIAQVKIQISPPPKAQLPTRSERVIRKGKDLNKLTYEESSLGQTSIYYQYEIEIGVNTLVIEAKYPQIDSTSAVLTEELIDSILAVTFDDNQVKGITSSLSESQAIELAKPSIVNITHLYCNTVTANKDKTVFLKQEYVICNNAKGTGFIINKEGYIATNGHVVQVFPEETLTKAFFENQGTLATDIVREIFLNFENRRISSSDAEIILANSRNNPLFFNSLLSYAYNLLDQKAISTNRKDSIYFINTGTEPIDIDFEKLQKGKLPTQNTLLTSQSVKVARLVGYDYPNRYTPNAILHNKLPLGSDVAILKLEGGEKTSLPILKLG
ncbi:MAG: serine protease, partial [Candidatus Blackburnbacteria bacterium]|nr:serine protease [Candidatus Blackburnbacteria bacterium]